MGSFSVVMEGIGTDAFEGRLAMGSHQFVDGDDLAAGGAVSLRGRARGRTGCTAGSGAGQRAGRGSQNIRRHRWRCGRCPRSPQAPRRPGADVGLDRPSDGTAVIRTAVPIPPAADINPDRRFLSPEPDYVAVTLRSTTDFHGLRHNPAHGELTAAERFHRLAGDPLCAGS